MAPRNSSTALPTLRLRGTIVNRTYGTHKNLYIFLFLLKTFGAIYYGPSVILTRYIVLGALPTLTAVLAGLLLLWTEHGDGLDRFSDFRAENVDGFRWANNKIKPDDETERIYREKSERGCRSVSVSFFFWGKWTGDDIKVGFRSWKNEKPTKHIWRVTAGNAVCTACSRVQ